MSRLEVDDKMNALQQRVDMIGAFGWSVVSGVTAIVWRDKGEEALNKLWRAMMTAEQKVRFLEALKKLGIEGTPAQVAAQYHYFSNAIGGINMQYIEETPKKVWIRYLPPWGTYPGISALTVPTSVRRTILSTWHPQNGVLLDAPRLGWVATKFVAEGHQYDEGYFMEYDHDLSPEERYRVEHVDKSPEFDFDKAPKLNPEDWPEERIMKAGANYATDYMHNVLELMVTQFGMNEACHMIASAMRLLAVQFTPTIKNIAGVTGNAHADIAVIYAELFGAFKNNPQVEQIDADTSRIVFDTFKPFPHHGNETMRNALFAFVDNGVKTLNGHIRCSRHYDSVNGTEVWQFKDEKQWLW